MHSKSSVYKQPCVALLLDWFQRVQLLHDKSKASLCWGMDESKTWWGCGSKKLNSIIEFLNVPNQIQ